MTLSLLSQTLGVIVGAQSGLARAFARRAAEAGAPMVLFARNADELAASKTDLLLRGSPYVETVQGDINDSTARQALVGFVSNSPLPLGLYLAAARMPDQAQMLANEPLCAQMLATNFTSSILLMNALLPLAAQRIGSSVVILSSEPQGRAHRLRKRSNHVTLVVDKMPANAAEKKVEAKETKE